LQAKTGSLFRKLRRKDQDKVRVWCLHIDISSRGKINGKNIRPLSLQSTFVVFRIFAMLSITGLYLDRCCMLKSPGAQMELALWAVTSSIMFRLQYVILRLVINNFIIWCFTAAIFYDWWAYLAPGKYLCFFSTLYKFLYIPATSLLGYYNSIYIYVHIQKSIHLNVRYINLVSEMML
jgi:hypothetical protein